MKSNNNIINPTTRGTFAYTVAVALLLRQQGMVTALTPTGSPSGGTPIYHPPKTIVLLRHGITYMNEHLGRSLSFGAPNFSDVFRESDRTAFFQDSPLSPAGVRQTQQRLASTPLPFLEDCRLIVTSPLTRALQTLEVGLLPHISRNIPIIALPHAAERLYLISDVGRRRSELQQTFPFVDFNTGFDEGIDNNNEWWFTPSRSQGKSYLEWRPTGQGQKYACPGEPQEAFDRRMVALVDWLDRRPEQKIVLVCHWGVIQWLLNDNFENCQWREVSHLELLTRAASMSKEISKR